MTSLDLTILIATIFNAACLVANIAFTVAWKRMRDYSLAEHEEAEASLQEIKETMRANTNPISAKGVINPAFFSARMPDEIECEVTNETNP